MGGGGGIGGAIGGAVSGVTGAVNNVVSNPVRAVTSLNPMVNTIGMVSGRGSPLLNTLTGQGGAAGQGGGAPIQLQSIDKPQDIQFNSGLNGAGGLQDQYKVSVGAMPQMNTQALDMLRRNATGAGLSSWGQAAMDQQRLNQQGMQDTLAKNVNAGQAQALNNMAMRGGVSQGARAMMGMNAAKDQMMQNQNLLRQGAQDRAGIQAQDAQTKQNMLSQLPGMELQALNPQFQYMQMQNQANQFNAQNALNQLGAQNAFNMDKYKTGMSAWGANQQANAQLAGLNNNQNTGMLGLGFMGL